MNPDTKKTVDDLTRQCKDGLAALSTSKEYLEYLKAISRFSSYSSRNVLLILLQNPKATLVAGYRDWQKKFNRCVKQGEKGIAILAPILRKKKEPDNDNTFFICGFRIAYVFDISQTIGEPLPQFYDSDVVDKVYDYSRIKAALSAYTSYEIELSDSLGGVLGLCRYTERKILLKSDLTEFSIITTLVHEIAHAELHAPDKTEGIKKSKCEREAEAESVAYIVCSALGMDLSDSSFKYILSYCSGEPPDKFFGLIDGVKPLSQQIIDFVQCRLEAS